MTHRQAYFFFVVLMLAGALSGALAGRHLIYDGSAFFVRTLHSASFASHDVFRTGQYLIVHAPVALAIRLGTTDLNLLSVLFGIGLFVAPLGLVAIATWVLLRSGETGLALALMVTHALCLNFTGMFIISESHLAMALFFLTLVILRCGDLSSFRSLAALVVIGGIAAFCYEFWVVFAACCAAVLLLRVRREGIDFSRNFRILALLLLYVGVFATNVVSMLLTKNAPNRDALIRSTVEHRWFIGAIIAVTVGLGAAALGALPKLPKLETDSNAAARAWRGMYRVLWLTVPLSALLGWLKFEAIAPTWQTYGLRSLNLWLPLIFAALVLSSLVRDRVSPPAYFATLFCCLVAVVVSAQLRHTSEWVKFKRSVVADLKQHHGYVSSETLPSMTKNPYAAGMWTQPVLSLVLQGLEGRNLTSIAYNPLTNWQPFGPPSCESPQRIALRYGMSVDPQISPNAPECRH